MADIKENLEKCYESIERHQSGRAFFFGLEDYLGLVLKSIETKKITDDLDKDRNAYRKSSIEDYHDKKEREVWGSWERLHHFYIAIDNNRYSERIKIITGVEKIILTQLHGTLKKMKGDESTFTNWVKKRERYEIDIVKLHGYLIRGLRDKVSNVAENNNAQSGASEEPEFKNPDPFTEIREKIKNNKKIKMGYFRFNKQSKRIEVGKPTTRKFRLLQLLTDPYCGTQRTRESVFEAIKLKKDEQNSGLLEGSSQEREEMIRIIVNTDKELRKLKEFQDGKLSLVWSNDKNRVWLATN